MINWKRTCCIQTTSGGGAVSEQQSIQNFVNSIDEHLRRNVSTQSFFLPNEKKRREKTDEKQIIDNNFIQFFSSRQRSTNWVWFKTLIYTIYMDLVLSLNKLIQNHVWNNDENEHFVLAQKIKWPKLNSTKNYT